MSPAACETTEPSAESNGHAKSVKPLDPMTAMGHGNVALEGVPEFDSFAAKRQWTLEHLAGAFRVFGREGYAEGIAGHISVRDPEFSDRFWINPLAVHFSMMRVSDLICLDMKGNVVGGNRDVCYFHKAHSVYRNYGGIAFESDEGTSIAHALGDNKAMILVNHGLITVGETVDEAAYLYTLLEKSCRIQLMVEATGMKSMNAAQSDVRDTVLTLNLRSVGLPKVIVRDEEAADTFRMASQPGPLFVEFQPSYKLEEHLNPDFKL
ncbi:hypothetical protein MBLNU13_g09614t2 [Cladosporium sp. NU13]